MKRIPSHPRFANAAGFTLIELLVVIAIIAILAAVLVGAGGAAINSAKRAQASNLANQIQTACLNYYTEYSVYPIPNTAAASKDYLLDDTTGSAANWKLMICALSGNISPLDGTAVAATTVSNTRGIAFLSMKKTDVFDSANTANVAPMNPLPAGTGHPYFNLAMDGDYDGVLGSATSGINMPNFSGTFSATTGGTSTAGVAVWANCNVGASSNPNWYVHTY